MNDFLAEPEQLKSAVIARLSAAAQSGWYILGKEVEGFENEWASVCGSDYAIGVANGMDAIEIILRSLDIGKGDEIITTPMTAFATILAIYRAGATPVLADIDPETALISTASAAKCISNRTKAVLLVHLYGQLRNMNAWQEFCRDNDIYLVEDCAQAHLSSWQGRKAGNFGKAAAFSFYPTKNLGALGDAGAVITSSQSLRNRVRRLRNYGQSERYHHPELGLNSRLDEIQAAVLSERLKWLEAFTERRQEIASLYFENFSNSQVRCLAQPEEKGSHVYHLFVVLSDRREELQAYLAERNIQTLIHYPIPAHKQPPCNEIRYGVDGLSRAEYFSSCCLSLPCHPQMSDDDIEQVIQAINRFS
jgi:dTDP-4-amino-4,6-dideoxygalactose transaminase